MEEHFVNVAADQPKECKYECKETTHQREEWHEVEQLIFVVYVFSVQEISNLKQYFLSFFDWNLRVFCDFRCAFGYSSWLKVVLMGNPKEFLGQHLGL